MRAGKRGEILSTLTIFIIAVGIAVSVLFYENSGITGASIGIFELTGDCGGNYSGSGNWEISTQIECSDDIMDVSGNITIQTGGNLTLYNTTINLTGDAVNGKNFINVTDGGALNVLNNSYLKNNESGIGWIFTIYNGTDTLIDNSTIDNVGYDDGDPVTFSSTDGAYFSADCAGNAILTGSTITNSYISLISNGNNCTFSHNLLKSMSEFAIASGTNAAGNTYINNTFTYETAEFYAIAIAGNNETVRQNTITMAADSTAIGFFQGDNNLAENNTIIAVPAGNGKGFEVIDGPSLGFIQSTNPKIIANTMNSTAVGIQIDITSSGKTFTNANISGNAIYHTSSEGINLISAMNNSFVDNIIDNGSGTSAGIRIIGESDLNSIIGGAISGKHTGIDVQNSSNITVTAVNVSLNRDVQIKIGANASNTTVYDSVLRSDYTNISIADIRFEDDSGASNITLVNTTFNSTTTNLVAGGINHIFVNWYLDVNVTGSGEAALENAEVNITDASGNNDFSGLTASTGLITTQTLLEYTENITTTVRETNYTVNASKNNINNTTSINLTSSSTVSLSLDLDSTAPNMTIHSPAAQWYNADFAVNATVDDTSDISTVQYRYENSSTNSSWTSMSNTSADSWNATFDISSVSDGNYTFRINATDDSGNYNDTETVSDVGIDSIYPLWYGNITNATDIVEAGQAFYFNITFNDTNPESIVFSFDNGDGFVNDSEASYTSGSAATVTKTVSQTASTIRWHWFANDSAGNENKTDTWSATVSAEYCGGAYNSTGTNWDINEQVNCTNEAINVNGNITVNNSGNFTLHNTTLNFMGTINGSNFLNVTEGGILNVLNGTTLTTDDSSIGWNFYINNATNVLVQNSTIESVGYSDENALTIAETEGISLSGNCGKKEVITQSTISGGYVGIVINTTNCNFTHNYLSGTQSYMVASMNNADSNLYMNNTLSHTAAGDVTFIILGSNESVNENNITSTVNEKMVSVSSGRNVLVHNNTLTGNSLASQKAIEVDDIEIYPAPVNATVSENTIFSAPNSISISTDSVYVVGNTIYDVDNSSAISVLSSHNTLINNSAYNGSKGQSKGINIQHGSNNTVTSLTADNFYSGVEFYNTTDNTMRGLNITNITLFGVDILLNSTNNTIYDSDIDGNYSYEQYFDIRIIEGSYLSNITLINVTFNKSSVSVPSGNLFTYWYLDLNVTDGREAALENAEVNITDASGNNDFSGLTASTGLITTQTLLEYAQNSTHTARDTNYTVNASKEGFDANSSIINLTASSIVQLSLGDSISPIWQDNLTNISGSFVDNGATYYFNITFNDSNPESVVFSFSDGSGFANDSKASYTSGSPATVSKTITATGTQTVQWYWYANDTYGNENKTDTFSATVLQSYCGGSYNNSASNWDITSQVNCTDEVVQVNGNITIGNSGNMTLHNTTLNFTHGTSNGNNFLNVTEGGILNVLNNSRLTNNEAVPGLGRWSFSIYNGSDTLIQNSTVENVGYTDGNAGVSYTEGLYIEADCGQRDIITGSTFKSTWIAFINNGTNCNFTHNNLNAENHVIASFATANNSYYFNNTINATGGEGMNIYGSNAIVERNTIIITYPDDAVSINSGSNNLVLNNTITGNSGISGQKGIAVIGSGPSVPTNTVIAANVINLTGAGIYVNSSGTNISRNLIANAADGFGIKTDNASHSVIESNTIDNVSSYGLHLARSINYSVDGITIIAAGSSGISLDNVSSVTIRKADSANNSVSGIEAVNNASGITLYDSAIFGNYSNSSYWDIHFSDTGSDLSNITLVNVSWNQSSINFTSAGASAIVYWYLDANVTYANGTAAAGAAVNITDISGNNDFSGLADADGAIATQTLLEYTQNGTATVRETNYTVNASKEGFDANWTIINLTANSAVTVGISDITAPTFDEGPENVTSEYGSRLDIDINASDTNGISRYFINDTSNFTINASTGVITNATNLSVREYNLNISANDTYNNIVSAQIIINVTDTTAPSFSNLTVSPTNGSSGTTFNISVEVSDPSNVDTVIGYIQQRDGTNNSTQNMSFSDGLYNMSWDSTGHDTDIYLIDLFANDTIGNNVTKDNFGVIVVAGGAKGIFTNNSFTSTAGSTVTINATSSANTLLQLNTAANFTGSSVNIVEFSSNPKSASAVGVTALDRYVDIILDNSTNSNLSNTTQIRIYYTDAEISAAGLEESTLKLYKWNSSNSGWYELSPTGVDTSNNYVWANVSSFSTFGVYGDAAESESSSSSSSSSGGGGISTSNAAAIEWQTRNIDFTQKDSHALQAGARDRIIFSLAGEQHTLEINAVYNGSARMTISSRPITFNMLVGEKRSFDLDNDGKDDIRIVLNAISSSRVIDIVIASVAQKRTEKPEQPEETEEDEPATVGDTKEAVQEETKMVEAAGKRKVSLWQLAAIVLISIIVGSAIIHIMALRRHRRHKALIGKIEKLQKETKAHHRR